MGWTIAADNYEGKAMVGITLALIILDFVCILLRLYAQHTSGRARYAISNYVLISGFLTTVGLGVTIYDTFSHDYGRNILHFNLEDAKVSSQLFPATQILWNSATTCIRISVILLYRQLLGPVKVFGRVCIGIAVLNIVNFICIFIVTLTICRPLSYIYLRVGPGHCGNIKAFETYTAVISIVLDTTVVVLPLPLLWKLQMKTGKKIGITVILSLGTIVCVLTVSRLILSYVYEVNNITKQSAIVDFVTGLEPTLGIILACMPFFPNLTRRAAERVRSMLCSTAGGDGSTNGTADHKGIKPLSSSSNNHHFRNPHSHQRAFHRLGDDTELILIGHNHHPQMLTTTSQAFPTTGLPGDLLDSDLEDGQSQQPCVNGTPRTSHKATRNVIYIRKDITVHEELTNP